MMPMFIKTKELFARRAIGSVGKITGHTQVKSREIVGVTPLLSFEFQPSLSIPFWEVIRQSFFNLKVDLGRSKCSRFCKIFCLWHARSLLSILLSCRTFLLLFYIRTSLFYLLYLHKLMAVFRLMLFFTQKRIPLRRRLLSELQS